MVYYAPRERKGALLTSVRFQYDSQSSPHELQASAYREPKTSTENTLVNKVPLPRGAYAFFITHMCDFRGFLGFLNFPGFLRACETRSQCVFVTPPKAQLKLSLSHSIMFHIVLNEKIDNILNV